MRRLLAVMLILLGCATTSVAHYNMLLPDKAWAKKDEKVTFTYQFGHPYEHELFDAPEPRWVLVILPDDGEQKIEKWDKVALKGADGKKVTGYRFTYAPKWRGDHTVILQTPPIWMEDARGFVRDTVKVVLHVQTQKNWDTDELGGSELMIVPLTRPYGLFPGMIFQGRAGNANRPVKKHAGQQIEVERYNATPPKEMPPDELITFKTKTDADGVFAFAFPEPGWWGMTAERRIFSPPTIKEGGKEGPLRERATFWLHVDEKK